MGDRVEGVILEITPQHQIARIVINEVDGSTTEYRFRDLREDSALPDTSFHFSPPKGVELIEGDVAE